MLTINGLISILLMNNVETAGKLTASTLPAASTLLTAASRLSTASTLPAVSTSLFYEQYRITFVHTVPRTLF